MNCANKAVAILVALQFAASQSLAQGITDFKPDAAGSPVTGSAGPEGASGAAPTLQKCEKTLGTIAVSEPQDFTQKALLRFNLPSPTGLIRLLIQQSNCFLVVERGVAMQNILQERSLSDAGQLRDGAAMGKGQLVTADFVLTPDVVFSSSDAGGAGAMLGGLFGVFGAIVAAGLKFKQAQTSMIVADTRSGLQVAAAQGSVEKADFGIGGIAAGTGAIGGLGVYESTAEGKVVAASFLANWNNVVTTLRSSPALLSRVETAPPSSLPDETKQRTKPEQPTKLRDSIEKGDVVRAKITGVKVLAQPSTKAKPVATLTKDEELVYLGEENGGFLSVQGAGGAGWVDKLFVRK